MIKFIFEIILNFLFFKVWKLYFQRYSSPFIFANFSVSFLFFILFFILIFFCLLLLFCYALFKITKIFEPVWNLLSLLRSNISIWLMNHFFVFFLDCLLFFHKTRFILFFGTSYLDPLLKIFTDRLSILKGELLMDFYNFSNKFIFENSFNIPISIFAYTPFFESSKNFYYVKIFYNLQNNLILAQNRSRTFFYFYFKKHLLVFKNKNVVVSNLQSNNYSHSKQRNFFSKIFLSSIFLFFNFFSFDFFVFLTRVNLILLENSSFFFFKIFFLKYFAYLRNCFTFLLINLEYDSFLNYIQIFLYKLSLRQYFTKSEWANIFNTYDLQFTNSYPFQGLHKFDGLLFIKITYYYLFIYFNYILFFFFCVLSFSFKFFAYLFIYFFQFFNVHFNTFSFFFNLFDFFYLFFFSSFVNCFIFLKKLIFIPFQNFCSNLFPFLKLENFEFFHYFAYFFYLFLLNILYFLKIIFSLFFLFFNNHFLVMYLFGKKSISFNVVRSIYSTFPWPNYSFYSILINILNSFDLKNFFLYNNYFNNVNRYLTEYKFYSKLIQLTYLDFFYSSKFVYYFSNYSIFCRFFFFSKLLRSYIFSYIFIIPILVEQKKSFIFSFSLRSFGKNFFFIDYFFDIFVFFLLLPFFFIFEFFKIFILKFTFYFFKILSNSLFFFQFIAWLLFSLFYFLVSYVELFVFLLFLIAFSYWFFIYFFSFLWVLFVYLFVFIFVFYGLFSFFSFLYSNKFYLYLYLFFKINLSLCYYYFKLISFVKTRNFGFLEILGIFFLVRNEFKKYEFTHKSISYANFNSLNTDFLLNNFLNKLMKKNFGNKIEKSSLFFNFLNFKTKFSPFVDSFLNFKVNKSRNNFIKVQIKSDITPELEYHKYLRLRDSRNFTLFRLRKNLDPKDIYFDSALDDISFFKSNNSANNQLDFDFTKSFYIDDFVFKKEMNFFRNVFSRKNLSFFYDDLDNLSNFRITFSKISPLFRYFYLKREKMKYLFSMYTFGNINYFSFSILFNWILFYRILRVTKNLFFSFNNSFILFNSKQIPTISLYNVSYFLDYLILKSNIFLNLIFYFLGSILFISFFPLSFFNLMLMFFFILKIMFLKQIFIKFSSYYAYIYRRPIFLHYSFIFFAFFNKFCFLILNGLFFKKFSFLKRFYLNFLVFFFYILLFFLCLLKFNFLNFYSICFNFFFGSFFFENKLFYMYFFNFTNFKLVMISLSTVEIFFMICLFFFFTLITRFIVFKFLNSKFYFFDKFLFIKFFLIFKSLKILKFYFPTKFNSISPYLVINELDFLIKTSKIENQYIKNNCFK